MKRILCIRLPGWPIQRLVVAQPELRNRVIILHARASGSGGCVVACSRAAYRYGIRPRMSLAEAVTLQETGRAAEFTPSSANVGSRGGTPRTAVPAPRHAGHDVGVGDYASAWSLEGEESGRPGACKGVANPDGWAADPHAPYIAEHHPRRDAEELERLAEWCECFSPVVGFESLDPFERAARRRQHRNAHRNDCLYLDVTHVSAYFGSERQLARLVAESFSRRGYVARVAVADTLGAAWACARFAFQAATVVDRRENEAPRSDLYGLPRRLSVASPVDERANRTEHYSHGHYSHGHYSHGHYSHGHYSHRRNTLDSGLTIKEEDAATSSRPETASRTETPGSSFLVVPSEATFTVLRSLPIQSLRLPAPTDRLLKRLGIFQLAQLACLPRSGLVSRFGKIVLTRWDQALGRIDEVLIAHRPPPAFQTDWTVEHATTNRAVIQSILGTLIERLAGALRQRGQGIIQCTGRLTCQKPFTGLSGNDGSLSPATFRIGLSHPTTCVEHVRKLVETRLERLTFPGPVQRIVLEASLTAPLACRQRQLFSDPTPSEPRHLNHLLDRLSSRLGAVNVVRADTCSDAQPELAYHEVPVTPSHQDPVDAARRARKRAEKGMRRGKSNQREGGPCQSEGQGEDTNQGANSLLAAPKGSSSPRSDVQHRPFNRRLIRPLHLRSPPLALAVVALAPDGPPARLLFGNRSYPVARCWGPERIETGWWRGRTVCRDYYRLETVSGHWLWVFRDLTDGNWFLHGTFG